MSEQLEATTFMRLSSGVEVLVNGVSGATTALILVPGAGGNFESPANGLYGFLALRMRDHCIATVQLRHSRPADLDACSQDVLQVVDHLRSEGVRQLGFVGWSFGGAVVIRAAAATPEARAVVTVATQSYGADSISDLGENVSVLLLHGSSDDVLPVDCSMHVFKRAGEHKELILYPGAGHALVEVCNQVHQTVYQWFFHHLRKQASVWRAANEAPELGEHFLRRLDDAARAGDCARVRALLNSVRVEAERSGSREQACSRIAHGVNEMTRRLLLEHEPCSPQGQAAEEIRAFAEANIFGSGAPCGME